MLAVHRAIGHKEYGNVGHPDRKSDPRYDMNWRRSRVANFQPRQQSAPAPVNQGDPDMRIIQQKDRGIAVVGPGYYKGLGPDELHAAGAMYGAPVIFDNAVDWDRAVSVATGGESVLDAPIQRSEQAGGGVTSLRAQTHWADYNLRTVVPQAVAELVGTPDVDADTLAKALARPEVAAAIGEAMAAATDRRARDGDPATGPVS